MLPINNILKLKKETGFSFNICKNAILYSTDYNKAKEYLNSLQAFCFKPGYKVNTNTKTTCVGLEVEVPLTNKE